VIMKKKKIKIFSYIYIIKRITVRIKSNCFGKPLIIKIDNDDHEDVEQLKEMINKLIEKKNKKVINI